MVPLEWAFCLPSFLRLHAYVCNISSHMQWLRTINRRDRVERLQPRCSCSLCLPLSLETNSKSKGGFTLGLKKLQNHNLLVESEILDLRSLHYGQSPKYERTKWQQSFLLFSCQFMLLSSLDLRKCSSLFAKLIVALGFNVEFESNVHLGLFRTQRFWDPDPCVNPRVSTLPT